jgi:hypothetical protein
MLPAHAAARRSRRDDDRDPAQHRERMEIALPIAVVLLLVTTIGSLMGIASWLRCGQLQARLERLEAVGPADATGAR